MYLIASEMYQGVPRTNMNQPLRAQSQCTVANLIQLKKGLMRTTQKIACGAAVWKSSTVPVHPTMHKKYSL